jgi:hypothetical protein
MTELCPGCDMPNDAKPANYPQEFMHAANSNKPGPTNAKAKQVPSDELAMRMFRGL